MSNTQTIQFKRGTQEQWDTLNPILSVGEPGFAIDSGVLKIGDGVTKYNSLPAISISEEFLTYINPIVENIYNLQVIANNIPSIYTNALYIEEIKKLAQKIDDFFEIDLSQEQLDTIVAAVVAEIGTVSFDDINNLSPKTTVANNDKFVIIDSADGNTAKYVTFANIPSSGGMSVHGNDYHNPNFEVEGVAAGLIVTHSNNATAHHSNANDPSSGEKQALSGTSGTPSNTNKFVTDEDVRNTNARTPTAHTHSADDVNSGTLHVDRIPNLDADKITSGTINIQRIPAAALERLVIVSDQTARFDLTTAQVQTGDTVKQEDTGIMYRVVDDTQLGNASGYVQYSAGSAASVPWSGVADKPTTFTPSSHTHTIADLPIATSGESSTTKIPRADDARLTDSRTPTAHDIAGALHNASTLAELNEKVSDATLIDTNDSRLSDARTPTAHSHTLSDITDSGGAAALNVGTSDGTVAAGDDSRLSDARTPTSHTHGNLSNDGKIGDTANIPLITGTDGVVQAGSFGTNANQFAEGNDSRFHEHANKASLDKIGESGGDPTWDGGAWPGGASVDQKVQYGAEITDDANIVRSERLFKVTFFNNADDKELTIVENADWQAGEWFVIVPFGAGMFTLVSGGDDVVIVDEVKSTGEGKDMYVECYEVDGTVRKFRTINAVVI